MPNKMPFEASVISGRYGDPRPGGRIHIGTDWAKPRGTRIVASGNGFVRRKNYSDLGGHQVVVAYDDGQDWIYYHSDNPFPIAVGARVQEGTTLGHVGSLGGVSTGPHVHVEVYMYPSSQAINPLSVMNLGLVAGQGAPAGGGETGGVVVGEEPLQVQLNLRLLGYYLGDLDGDPGPQTKAAIEAFQAAEGLDKDGVAGTNTNGRLWQRVKEVQVKLQTLGFYKGAIDGENGDGTAGAVRALQGAHGLEQDGIVGPMTRAKIEALLIVPPVVPPTKPTEPAEPAPGESEADYTPNLVTPTAMDYPAWIQYDEKFDEQVLASPTWNMNAAKYYGQKYLPVESHCHWWGLPREAGTHDGNVGYLNRTEDVGANLVTSPVFGHAIFKGRVTLTTPLNKIALTTGKYNPIAWKTENDPIMTVPEGREWGYKTLAAVHYLVEKLNPALRQEAIKLHKDYYATACSDIDPVYLRSVIEDFHSGRLDIRTGLPPVTVPDPTPGLGDQIAEAYRDLGDLLEKLPEGI